MRYFSVTYKNEKIEDIVWIDKELDFDLEEELNTMQFNKALYTN